LQLELDYLKDRQMEDILIAVTEEKYKGCKSIEVLKLWDKHFKMYRENTIKAIDIMKILELKKTTFYNLMN